MRRKPTAIDLFSGLGGLTLGLKMAGFRVLGAIDADPLAVSTYRRNHRRVLCRLKEIRDVNPAVLMKDLGLKAGELSLLAGCPPCQGFSRLRTLNGHARVVDPMNDLVFEFIRFARVFLPKAIMMENVPRLADDLRLVEFARSISKLGYNYRTKILDAEDYGIPQHRRRMILIASRGFEPAFAHPVPMEERKTVKSVLWNFPNPERSNDPAHNYRINRSSRVMQIIRRIPKDGGSRSALPSRLSLHCHNQCDGFSDVYGRMKWSKPSPTITGGCINPSRGRFLHPQYNRAITVREAALLQGFPRDYYIDFSCGRYPAAQMVGNAFPPEFAAAHARQLAKDLDRAFGRKLRRE